MLTEVRDAEDREHFRDTPEAFDVAFRPQWPNAVDTLSDYLEVLVRLYDYPAEHWPHRRPRTSSSRRSRPFGYAPR